MKKRYNILSLFSGCGGMDDGFEKEGFGVPFANEFWKPAQDSYEASHPHSVLFREDIRKLTNEKIDKSMKEKNIGGIDGIIGGPPCQGFSMAGSRNREDPRNKLFLEFARLVEHLRPKFFVFENVKGLLTMTDEEGNLVINQIVKTFKEIDGGYQIQYKILNSADYGVPQKRERVIIIGVRQDLPIKRMHPKPTHAPNTEIGEIKGWFRRNGKYFFDLDDSIIRAVEKAKSIEDLPKEATTILGKMKPWTVVSDFIGELLNMNDENDEFNHKPMKHTDIVVKRMSMIPEGKNIPEDQSGWPEELKRKKFASVYRRLNRNEPACTMVPGHSAFPIHYSANRSLTVREAARIQTLPDSFKFFGSKTQQCLVVGNAVPSLMARSIAKNIKEFLEKSK